MIRVNELDRVLAHADPGPTHITADPVAPLSHNRSSPVNAASKPTSQVSSAEKTNGSAFLLDTAAAKSPTGSPEPSAVRCASPRVLNLAAKHLG